MNSKAIQEQKSFSSRLPPILLAVVLLVVFLPLFFLPPAVWAESSGSGGTANKAPIFSPAAAANYDVAAGLTPGEIYTLNLADIFQDDGPLTYYAKVGNGSIYTQQFGDGEFHQTAALYTYRYHGKDREAIIHLAFKASDGSLESPVYKVTIKYNANPFLGPLEYMEGPTSVVISDCDKNATRITIPDYIAGKPVTVIGPSTFKDCTKLTEIKLPSTLKIISHNAFFGCTGLTVVNLPEGLTQLGEQVFWKCMGLRDVYIPASLKEFDLNIFTAIPNLHFTVAAGNPNYASQDGALYSKDKTVLIRAGASGGGSFTVPDTVTAIAADAFVNNGLETVVFGPNVKTVGKNAFQGCAKLKKVVLNEGLESIGDNAFEGATALKTVVLPVSLSTLGQSVFKGSGLESIDFSPTRVETLPYWTFRDCAQLRKVTLGDTITELEEGVFSNCTALAEVTLPAKLRLLKRGVFNNCTALESLKIPFTVKFLGGSVFANCVSLKSICFEGNMPMRGDGYGTGDSSSVWARENDSFAQLPLATAKNLKIYVLQGAYGWGDSFEDYADGYGLGTTSRRPFTYKVETYTLDEAPRLILHAPPPLDGLETGTTAEPVGVVQVGPLTGAGPVNWSAADETIAAVDDAGRVTGLKEGITAITASLTYDGTVYTAETAVHVVPQSIFNWSLQSDGTVIIKGFREGIAESQMVNLEIPATFAGYMVSAIGNSAFGSNKHITSVRIPGTVKIIGPSAFGGCSNLQEVSMEEGIEEISTCAFAKTGIKEIVVPESVIWIRDKVFFECKNLETAVIKANNLTYGWNGIGYGLFENCTSLKNVTFAEGIKGVGDRAFKGCSALESVTFPSTLQLLGSNTFLYCSHLKTVEFKGYPTYQSVHLYANDNNPFLHAGNVTVVHPDDGAVWNSFFAENVKTGVRTADGGIRLDGTVALPAGAGAAPAVNIGTGSLAPSEAVEVTAEVAAAGSVNAPGGEEDSQNRSQKETGGTVFEIVKETVAQNPWLTAALGTVVLAIVLLGGAGRYRKYKKNN